MSTPAVAPGYGPVLRDFCDERHEAVRERFMAAAAALDVARVALEARLDLLNEFRAQSEDEGRAYARRENVELMIGGIEKRVRDLEQAQASSAGSQRTWAVVAGAATGMISSIVVGLVLRLLS